MNRTIETLREIAETHMPACIAFSGGTDSRTLIDVVYRKAGLRLPLLCGGPYSLKPPGTKDYNNSVAAEYGAEIYHAPEAGIPPVDQWRLYGWPMLGKMNARKWSQTHKGQGFKIDCSSCCKRLTIDPVRKEAKRLGFRTILTGMRTSEALIREKNERKHADIYWVKASGIYQANPIAHWTDTRVRRYCEQYGIRLHPDKARGAKSIGCVMCGGGGQFDEATWPICRRLWPDQWRRFIVQEQGGLIILAIKHNATLPAIREAVHELGGLKHLAETKPWLFDYLRSPPLPSYRK